MSDSLPPSYPPASHRGDTPQNASEGVATARGARGRRRSSFLGGIGEILFILCIALLISTLLRQFVLQIYSIPSASMETTLNVGDRILVNRIPVVGKQVQRGDVVVFEDQQHWMRDVPESENSFIRSTGEFLGIVPADGKQVLVKRVIGVGGDTVSSSGPDGKIEVNGQPLDETYLDPGIAPATREFSVTVPDGKYWVMGDNRPESADSLYHLSEGTEFIDSSAIIGRAQWVIWPVSHWHTLPHREVFADVPSPS